jgi:hypothetical protein
MKTTYVVRMHELTVTVKSNPSLMYSFYGKCRAQAKERFRSCNAWLTGAGLAGTKQLSPYIHLLMYNGSVSREDTHN